MKVFIIAAVTADGFIGRDAGHTADWTGGEDKKFMSRITKEAGVIVMGSRTHETIGRALPNRRNIVYTSRPDEITTEGIEKTSEDPAALVTRLEQEDVRAVAIFGGASIYDLFLRAKLVDELYLTVAPILFGCGVSLFANELDATLHLLDTSTLADGAVVLHYAVQK